MYGRWSHDADSEGLILDNRTYACGAVRFTGSSMTVVVGSGSFAMMGRYWWMSTALSAASDTWRQVAPRLLHMIVVIGRRPVCAQRSPCSRPTSGRTCINCMLCHLACPSYALEPVFLGPAAIAIAQRYNLDSRDEGSSKRIDALSAPDGVWGCTSVGECTSVCPEGDDPAGAVAAPAAALQRWCHGDSSAHAVILLLFGMIFPLELVAPPDHKHLLVLDYSLIRVVLSECACSPSSIARTASTISFAIVCN